jgi:nitroimidazol reductase NimA-like FMN-containing flavoprotein (pyridoxamine 5'-phosphate oxidase superfamily)/ribosomal protein S18 acetylase RimI-like enzyme
VNWFFCKGQSGAILPDMRREIHRMPREEAVALLGRAAVLHLATTTPDGAPVLRALDGAVVDGAVAFHGARAGEKAACLGRPAVVSAEEVVAHVPSYFVDPERACPASTFYRSVQVHGTLLEITEPAAKARALSALMRRWQPEGGYRPIDPEDPLYRGELRGVLVFGVALERVDGKAKLGQNRTPADRLRIIEGLWRRGEPGDPAAIEAIRAVCPDTPVPAFLAAPAGATLHAALPAEAAEATAALLEGEYWWTGGPRDLIPRVQLASQAWVGARDAAGRLVASARAVSDGKTAWLYDVVVQKDWRGRGLGQRLVALTLDHPAIRSARAVKLATKDAHGLYARFGFVDAARRPRPFPSTEMVLVRE